MEEAYHPASDHSPIIMALSDNMIMKNSNINKQNNKFETF